MMLALNQRQAHCIFSQREMKKMRIKHHGNSPRSGRKAHRAAAGIGPICNIIQGPGVTIKHWIEKSQWTFTNGQAFLDNAVNHRGKDRRAYKGKIAILMLEQKFPTENI